MSSPHVPELPGRLQACYLVERELFAWWGVDDPRSAAAEVGLPAGRPEPLSMALPSVPRNRLTARPEPLPATPAAVPRNRLDGAVVPVTVPAALVDPDVAVPALARWRAPDASASLRAWSRIAAALDSGDPAGELPGLAAALPTAGHAALALDGMTIWSASATVTAARTAHRAEPAHTEAGRIHAVLRPYQRAGVSWLAASSAHGGGVLADEMGLGKTVQAIAVLAGRRADARSADAALGADARSADAPLGADARSADAPLGADARSADAALGRPHLVVCPTSLLGNWARELARFAPELDVVRYAGPERSRLLTAAGAGTVVLTSYGVLRADANALGGRGWDVVVLDEAQQIKNPDARAARAARALDARLRVAMTGTPVENRLDELWSLLAFTNPGLLGTRSRFRGRFAVAVEQRRSSAAAARLHEIVGPHILRRRKRDVAPELPPKIETTVLCAMTDEQRRLYLESLDEAFDAGLGTGIGRRGRVLALLTRLKQICNHPEQVRPTGAPLAGRSGKLDRATEILAEIRDNDPDDAGEATGDRALVFTQYRATGELLAGHLAAEVTGRPVPFLHGGLPPAARERMVAEFSDDPDGPPILVLSLRAAGFGLNLTRATHVLHFDRWWNPAVEDQASDRAHRIGQTCTVTVHTLLTEHTLEETIAELHAGKRDLAGVATGEVRAPENDLARLSDEQLRAVLTNGERGTRGMRPR
ncbi:DEAD/DEAH box helicase [Pseudonocardia acaciae]|uniref:DEAD/DEAH box helicase n=1 Tax=Pseudonocardia acaciae TaxID=551276 RepID=UPI0012EE5D73|nr:DEAD/DEAH box helicase [Pseudonocardia acaciae]